MDSKTREARMRKQLAPPQRYYMHGDELEDEKGMHYCSVLDLGMPPDHFADGDGIESCCGAPTRDLVRRDIRHWDYVRKRGDDRYRPEDANNPWKTIVDVRDRMAPPPRHRHPRKVGSILL